MATPKNFLHLWDDRFLYITPAIQSGLTARSSATVLASGYARVPAAQQIRQPIQADEQENQSRPLGKGTSSPRARG